jgi:hypothetical protein
VPSDRVYGRSLIRPRLAVSDSSTIGVMPMPENHDGHSTDPDTLVSIMRAVDPRVRAIVDWGNFRVESQAHRIESTRELLPYAGLISAKVDRFDADYRPGYDVGELVRLVESKWIQREILRRDHEQSAGHRSRGARRHGDHSSEPRELSRTPLARQVDFPQQVLRSWIRGQ